MPTLDAKEKSLIQKSLGQMASPLYTTLAKLYLCGSNETEWRDTGIWGAVSVVFDRTPPASRHIKIFDMQNYQVKFSQELHEFMSYTAASEQFHTFEAQSCIVGLSFTDVEEAAEFMAKVKSMIPPPGTAAANGAAANTSAKKKPGFLSTVKSIFGKADGPVEIGRPTDFVHKQHIGYDPATGFQSTDIPSEWASIFKNAGIKRSDLQNPEVAAVIYSTLQSQFGGDAPPLPHFGSPSPLSIQTNFNPLAATQSLNTPNSARGGSQPPSPSVPARPSASSLSQFRPQPPSPKPADSSPPPLPSGSRPPPAPPAHNGPPAPPSNIPAAPQLDIPPAPAADAPEAPPMVSADAPPPPPFAVSSALPPPPPTTVNKTEAAAAAPPPQMSVVDHLDMIRSGVTLRKVAKPDKENALPDVSNLNKEEATTLTAVLQNAMKARLANIQAVDDDSDDDGWE